MSDNILTGHDVAVRYIKFLSLKLESDNAEVAEMAKYICDSVDDSVELKQRYKQLFSKYRINTQDKKEIVYITEKILEYINK